MNKPTFNANALEKAISYTFTDYTLLELALTHRSFSKVHNERLEFLGDAILGMVIAEKVFQQFPNQPEGKLTRMRASLVNRQTLAEIAREIQLGKLIKLGSGELKSGGHRRESILSDAFEAIIGALYLDNGFDAAKEMILKVFECRLDSLDPLVQIKDSKTQLQEFLQSRKFSLPVYEIVSITGKDHAQTFTVKCSIKELDTSAIASGTSRRIAEQEAAKKVLEIIVNECK